MIRFRFKRSAGAALTSALLAMLLTSAAYASDHIDGPQLANDHASDINDMYFFLDPNDNSRAVMIMTINPFLISSEIIGQAIFDHNVRYRFEIENTGDASSDLAIDVQFSRYVGREVAPGQRATIRLFGRRSFSAPVPIPSQGADVEDIAPPPLTVKTDARSGVQFYAGATDDPFFLDNTAANRFVLSSIRNPGNPDRSIFANRAGLNTSDGLTADADAQMAGQLPRQAENPGVDQGQGRDTYAGFNTLLIALSVPVALLRGTGDELGLNGVTQRRQLQTVRRDGQVSGDGPWVNVDREGVPLVNNGLIPPARKDEYNGATPLNDARGKFRADIVQSLRNFGSNDQTISTLLRMIQVRGDYLRLKLSVPNSGPGGGNNPDGGAANMGGRRLQDDVVDVTFTLINNGQPLGDFVDRNDFEFGNTFPFVAPQVMPNPNGINDPDTRVRL